VTCYYQKLAKMEQETDLSNPETVRIYISKLKVCNATKNKYATAYNHLVIANGLTWKKPYYKVAENTPLIPKKDDVQAIITNCSEKYACIFTIEAEIGACPKKRTS
jgi:hypothetical protein